MTKVVKLQLTQMQAVEMLQASDHCFLTKEAVEAVTKPFGFVGKTFLARNTLGPDNPKGLLLNDGIEEAEGQDASEVAKEICRHLNIEFVPMMGRGSQLRMCCLALLGHLKTTDETRDARMKAAGFRKRKTK
jgi:hypothetical protein